MREPEVALARLQAYASAIAGASSSTALPDVVVLQACLATGAARAAILERSAFDGLLVRSQRGAELPRSLLIGDLQAALWGVLMGRTQLAWSSAVDAPIPVSDAAGWDRGIAVRMGGAGKPTRLLLLGGLPEEGASPQELLGLVQSMADIAGPVIDLIDTTMATRSLRGFLRRITGLAGRFGAALSPDELLRALADGLLSLPPVDGVRVWAPGAGPDDPPTILADVGVPRGLDAPGVLGRVARLIDPTSSDAVRSLLEAPARMPDPGGLVSLITLSVDPPMVMGLTHSELLDELSSSVLTGLVAAIGPALRQTEIAAERRSLLRSYTGALRPSARPAGLELAVEHHPNTKAPGSFGGDFYDWFDAGDQRAVVALGDVSGKGIDAATAASMVIWSLRAVGARGAHPGVISHLLNDVVGRELEMDRFVTLALVVIDVASFTAEVLVAGHPAPIMVSTGAGSAGAVSTVAVSPAPPLGVDAVSSAVPPCAVELAPGDALVLYTDGATDAQDAQGRRLGEERLLAAAARAVEEDGWTAKSLAASLWGAVHAWAGGPPDDDCAILVLRHPTSS